MATNVAQKFAQPNDRCVDWEKDTPEGWHSFECYHATSDKHSVCSEGLKPRCELEGGEYKCGLGGGPSELISFTTDEKVAENITQETKRLIMIANGEYNWDNIDELVSRDYLEKDKALKSYQDNFPEDIMTGDWLWEKTLKQNPHYRDKRDWEEYKNGWVVVQSGGMSLSAKTIEEIEEEARKQLKRATDVDRDVHCEPYPEERYSGAVNIETLKEKGLHLMAQCYMPEQVQRDLFEHYRSAYLWERTYYGGDDNPVFFGKYINDFRGADPDKVGVAQARCFLPYSIEYLQDLKHRIKTGKPVSMKETDLLEGMDTTFEEKHGWSVAGAMDEVRLSKNMFDRLTFEED